MKIIILFLFCLHIYSCQDKSVRIMDSMEVMGQLNNQFIELIDLREFNKIENQEIAKGAHWISATKIIKNPSLLNQFSKKRTLVIYGAKNSQKQIINIAIDNGYKISVMDSFQDWKKNNLPLKKITP